MKAADSADRKVNITFGFQQRYGGIYIRAKQLLDSGAIGKVREVHGEFLKFALKGDEPVPPPPRNEREKLEQWKLWRSTFGEVIGETGYIETARQYWTYSTGGAPVTERSQHDISIDALQEFVRRVAEGKPENAGVRAAESTLTSILGQMAIDRRREVTWDEMMRSA